MTAPPVELTYGTVKWWVLGLIADTTADGDTLPDAQIVTGRVYVTMDVDGDGVMVQESPTPATILKTRTELLIVNGHLQDKAGNTSVKLLANDSTALSQQGWTYFVEYELDDGLTFGSFHFELGTGETVDLSMVVPLAEPSPGVVITKGEKGDPATLTVGTVTTSAPGGAAVVTNVGTVDDAIFNFTLPRGDPGPPAPDASATVKGILQLTGDLGGSAAVPTVVSGANHAHTSAQVSDATSFATVDRIAYRRNASGRSRSDFDIVGITDAPTAADHATRKDYVDGRTPTDPVAGTAGLRTLGSGAQQAKPGNYAPAAADISNSTAVGRSVLTAVDAAAARTAIGAGTSSLALGTTSTTAKAGDYQPTAANISDSTATGRSVLTAASATAARAAIGAGVVDSSDGSILQVIKLTQAAYDAIVTKSTTTLYIIQG